MSKCTDFYDDDETSAYIPINKISKFKKIECLCNTDDLRWVECLCNTDDLRWVECLCNTDELRWVECLCNTDELSWVLS